MRLAGKAAVMTGGGSGIGLGIALACQREGANIAIPDIQPMNAEKVADEVKARGRRCVRLAKNRFAVGSPAQVVDALLAQHTAGVTHATMRVSCPGRRQDDILAGVSTCSGARSCPRSGDGPRRGGDKRPWRRTVGPC